MIEKKKAFSHENNSDFQKSDYRSQDEIALLRHAEKINETLFEISNAVNTTLNLEDLYRSIHESLARIIDVTNFFIAIVDSKKRTLYFPYHVDTADDDFNPISDFNTDSSMTGLVVLQRKPILLEEKALKERAAKGGIWGPVPLIWMGIPLIVKDTVIGVMAVQSYTDPHLYDHLDLQVLSAVPQPVKSPTNIPSIFSGPKASTCAGCLSSSILAPRPSPPINERDISSSNRSARISPLVRSTKQILPIYP